MRKCYCYFLISTFGTQGKLEGGSIVAAFLALSSNFMQILNKVLTLVAKKIKWNVEMLWGYLIDPKVVFRNSCVLYTFYFLSLLSYWRLFTRLASYFSNFSSSLIKQSNNRWKKWNIWIGCATITSKGMQ